MEVDRIEGRAGSRTLTRRRFLLGAGAGIAAAALAGDMFAVEPRRVLVSRHDIPIAGLPASLDGLRIAHVSDVHLPANRAAAEATLRHLAAERAEIVVLTGDICETAAAGDALADFTRRARGALATVATLGNWEYRGGLDQGVADRVYASVGVRLLTNANLAVDVGGASLTLVGIDDLRTGAPNVRAALPQRPDGVQIWLTHSPELADRLPSDLPSRPAAILAGHTHGGQIRIPGLPVYTPVGSGRFVAGWYRDTFAPLYVSRGIGTADIRARLFCPPELPIFTLRRV